MLTSIDSTLGYAEIVRMRSEALTLRAMTQTLPLRKWLEEFITECDSKLPSHKCWLEDDDDENIVLESNDDLRKHILAHIEFEFEGLEQVGYATVKRYELKHQKEPAGYNQSPPGIYKRYPYLYRIRISHETWLQLTKLHCDRIIKKQNKAKDDRVNGS